MVVLAALAGLVAAATSAEAANKNPKPRQQLDLELRKTDLRAALERRKARGYAVTLRESPWSVLADNAPPIGGLGIPQAGGSVWDSGGPGNDELSLRGLLDGETFTVLRIRLAPERP